MNAFGNYQYEIYFQGLTGVLPTLPMSYAELEERARHALSPSVWSYVAGGAGDEHTQDGNVTAFRDWGLMPRMLVGATERDLSVELWGSVGRHQFSWHRSASSACVPRTVTATSPPPRRPPPPGFRWSPRPWWKTRWRTSPRNSGTPQGFSSFTVPTTATLPRASSAALTPPATTGSSSRWTPGSRAGARGTWRCRTFRSCAASVWPTTPATRCSGRRPGLPRAVIPAMRSCTSRASSASR